MRNIILLFISLFFLSCDFFKNRTILNEFIGSEISIPTNFDCYFAGNDTLIDVIDSYEKKMIVYYDSSICSTCEISGLNLWFEIIDYRKWTQGKFSVLFIFSPKADKYDEVLRGIKNSRHIDVPILIDKEGVFLEKNSHIPNTRNYHTFMIDENNKVVVVGNPRGNEKIWELYKEQISVK